VHTIEELYLGLTKKFFNMKNWIENDNTLSKTFEFNSFLEAIAWMVRASAEIEKQNHHPKWTNEYNKVHVSLTTHDKGNTITQKDRELARAFDLL
jgi:4a-hydroxytetrahydrobiopterin dehydratase